MKNYFVKLMKLLVILIFGIFIVQTVLDLKPSSDIYDYLLFNKSPNLYIDYKTFDNESIVVYFEIKKEEFESHEQLKKPTLDFPWEDIYQDCRERKIDIEGLISNYQLNKDDFQIFSAFKPEIHYRLFLKAWTEVHTNIILVDKNDEENEYYRGIILISNNGRKVTLK